MAGKDDKPLPGSFSDQLLPRSNGISGSTGRKRSAEHLERPEEEGRTKIHTANSGEDSVSMKRQKSDGYQTTEKLVVPLYLKRKAVTKNLDYEERDDDDKILPGLSSDVEVATPARNKRLRISPDTVAFDDEDEFMFQARDQDEHGLPQSLVLESFTEAEVREDADNDDINDEQVNHVIEDIPLQPPHEGMISCEVM